MVGFMIIHICQNSLNCTVKTGGFYFTLSYTSVKLIKKERMVLSNECEILRAGFWIKEAIRSLWEWMITSPQLSAETLEQDRYKPWESWAQALKGCLWHQLRLLSWPFPWATGKHWWLGLLVTANQLKYWAGKWVTWVPHSWDQWGMFKSGQRKNNNMPNFPPRNSRKC